MMIDLTKDRFRFLCPFVLLTLLLTLFICLYDQQSPTRHLSVQPAKQLSIVYMRNGYQMSGDAFPKLSKVYEVYTKNNCNLSKPCHMVLQGSAEDTGHWQGDLVVFYVGGIGPSPPVKYFGQTWIYVGQESPFTVRHINLKNYNGLFNYTVSYHLHSTHAMPFGVTKRLENSRSFPNDFFSLKLKLMGVQTNFLSLDSVWIVSNCYGSVRSARNEYVSELSALGLPIQIFSRTSLFCSTILGVPVFSSNKYDLDNYNQYTFYLAFENALCKDYISEKLWKVLRSDSLAIPVVVGGKEGRKDYDRVAPPNSFIHIQDYGSPEELVRHLKRVVSVPELFNSYHEWRKTYYAGFRDIPMDHNCEYCRLAQEKPVSIINNFSELLSMDQCIDIKGKSCSTIGACSWEALWTSWRIYFLADANWYIIAAVILLTTFIIYFWKFRKRKRTSICCK